MGIVAESLTGIIERLTSTNLFKGIKAPEDLAGEIVNLFLYRMIKKAALNEDFWGEQNLYGRVEKGMETCEGKIDKEWVELILIAKQLGLTIEEIQDFIKQSTIGPIKGKIQENHK